MSNGRNADKDLKQQLATVRGHIDGVSRMVDQGRDCADVLHQVSAIQGALVAVRRELLERHITRCVYTEMLTGDYEKVIESIVDVVIGGSPRTLAPSKGKLSKDPDDRTEYRHAGND